MALGLAAENSAAGGSTGTLLLTGVDHLTISEDGGVATVTAARGSGSTGDVGATVSVAGSAAAGERTINPTTISWPNGNINTKSFTITAVDDNVADGDKTVIVDLTSPTGGAAVSSSPKTVTILDDEAPGVLTFHAPLLPTISETGGSTVVPLLREDGSSGAVGATVSVGGTAGPDERTVAPTTVNFADGVNTGIAVVVTA